MAKKNVSDLTVNPRNPRKISEERLTQLKSSMAAFGDISGIVFNRRTGHLVGGNQRSKEFDTSARVVITKRFTTNSSGTVAVGYISHQGERFSYREVDWPEDKEMAAMIAANKNAGEWDTAELTSQLKHLASFDVDFDLSLTMFEPKELQDLGIKDIVVSEHLRKGVTGVDEDLIPEKAEVRTRLGDLFQLGNHRLLCGDSTKEEEVSRLMDGEKADMVFTDPPYNTGMSPKDSRISGGGSRGSTWLNHFFDDNFTDEEWDKFLNAYLDLYHRYTQEDVAVYICLDWRRSYELVFRAKKRFKFSNLIVWDKVVHGLGSDYKYTHEFIHVFKKGKPELITNHGREDYQDIWHVSRIMGKDEEHATKKPVELVERAITHASKENNIVLDLFLGSGSTLIACEKTNRRCFGMEIDPHYCDVIIERWEKYTGKKAKLLSSKVITRKNAKNRLESGNGKKEEKCKDRPIP